MTNHHDDGLRGRIPLSRAALLRAMELNGVQVANNHAAFEWGRRCAHNLQEVQALYRTAQVIQLVKKPSLQELVERRVAFLADYQNAAYAARYRSFVEQVQAAEARVVPSSTQLSEAVARYLFKLMAYKDEYEVARLHLDAGFQAKIAQMFEGDYKLVHHLAPPSTAARDAHGHLVKKAYGASVRTLFQWLARGKVLRGTAFDPFGRTEERKTERALIAEYRDCIEGLLPQLMASNLALAVQIARIPEDIRGYGHVKERHLQAARSKWQQLLAQWHAPPAEEAPQVRQA